MKITIQERGDVKVKVDFRSLSNLKKKLKLPNKLVKKWLGDLKDDIKKDTPEKSGMLKSGIKDKTTAAGGDIYISGRRNNRVAGYLIKGTKRHWVRPRRAKALAFMFRGKLRFSKGHRVKGIKKGFWNFAPSRQVVKKVIGEIRAYINSRKK